MVVLKFLVLFLGLTTLASSQYEPSFRSSWNEGGKPILRGGGDENEFDPRNPIVTGGQEPAWVSNLRSSIQHLVQQYGLKGAQPYLAKLVDDTENKQKVLLGVEVKEDGKSNVQYKEYLRSADPPPTAPPEPEWLKDFKSFLKNLIAKYGKEQFDDHATPVIRYVEKMQNVKIKDIDVDEYGEVFVSYVEKPGSVLSKILG